MDLIRAGGGAPGAGGGSSGQGEARRSLARSLASGTWLLGSCWLLKWRFLIGGRATALMDGAALSALAAPPLVNTSRTEPYSPSPRPL